MIRIDIKPYALLLATATSFCALNVYACEFHGAFGGKPWGQHSVSPKVRQTALSAPSLIKAEIGIPIVVEVELDLKTSEMDAQVELSSNMDASIKLTEKEVRDISSTVKLYRLTLLPEKLGTFRLSFTANIDNTSYNSVKMTSSYLRVAEVDNNT